MDRPTKCFLRNNLADFFQSLFAYVGYYIHLQIYIIEAHCCLTFKFVLLLHLYIFSQPIPLTFSTKRYKLLFTAAFYIICTSTLILFCMFCSLWSVLLRVYWHMKCWPCEYLLYSGLHGHSGDIFVFNFFSTHRREKSMNQSHYILKGNVVASAQFHGGSNLHNGCCVL